jgi:hypothetical protein
MSLAEVLSTVGLLLIGGLSTGLTVLLNIAWNPCNVVKLPDIGGALSSSDCAELLSSGASASPAAANVVFALTLAARIEGCFFIATAVGSFYALTLPLHGRHALLLPLAVVATLAACVDGNSAGIVPFGANAAVTPEGKEGGVVLMGVWSVIATCLWIGFAGSDRTDPRFAKLVRTLQKQGQPAKQPTKDSGKGAKKTK